MTPHRLEIVMLFMILLSLTITAAVMAGLHTIEYHLDKKSTQKARTYGLLSYIIRTY